MWYFFLVYAVGVFTFLQIRSRSQCHNIIFFYDSIAYTVFMAEHWAKVQRSAWFLVGGVTGGQAYWLWWSGKAWVFSCWVLQRENFNCTLRGGQRRARPNMTRRCISDWPLSHRLNIPPVTNRALYCNGEKHAFKTVSSSNTNRIKHTTIKNHTHLSMLRYKDLV